MYFKDRVEAGKKLARALRIYQKENPVIYALPRGGVVIGFEVARKLKAPLELIITRKIGHPSLPEYAVAAIAENGHLAANIPEVSLLNHRWFKKEAEKERQEAVRRRRIYLAGRLPISPMGRTAILVDDGIATGLTIQAAIQELKHLHPKKIVVAVPVAPPDIIDQVKKIGVETVVLEAPSDFLGSIGAYFQSFIQISDEEVVELLKKSRTTSGKKQNYESLVYDE